MTKAGKPGASQIDRAQAIEGIRKGLKSFEQGKGKPAMKALRELKRRHGIQG